jgi:diacylglycerol kinase
MTPRPFELTARLRAFRYAFAGVWTMLRSQHNAWIHAAATAVTVALGLVLRLGTAEWCWIVLAIMSVWTAEALNTAIAVLVDLASPARHPLAGKAKDVAAGAVLVSAIGAAVIGIVIFGARLLAWTR